MNLETSFAFKRVWRKDQAATSAASEAIFDSIIREMMILRHPSIQQHPNIVELQGICWDIPYDEKVWPVLVFEKSQYGDLYEFAKRDVGRQLAFSERLRLCLDIGTAVADMHSHRIIHGDIKPSNVLVFKDNTGAFTAKVTDFGYSTCYTGDDLIKLPRSRPWDAPELESIRKGVNPEQACKVDVFSFGLLCLWLLFEKNLVGIEPLPTSKGGKLSFNSSIERLANVLNNMKEANKLVQLAHELLVMEMSLNHRQKRKMKQFFSKSLTCDTSSREADIKRLMKLLDPNR